MSLLWKNGSNGIQKTNHLLGLCRQHAHKTSIEFINEGDLEKAFRALDEGDIHYAPEVRCSWDLLLFASTSRPLIDESIFRPQSVPWVSSAMKIIFILLVQFLHLGIASMKLELNILM